MKNHTTFILKIILFSLSICIIYSCSSQKDTATSRGLQNLTARYNYIYNSNIILDNHQTELAGTYVDNYNQILPIYIGPEIDSTQIVISLNLKPMDDIIQKAHTIILEKGYSNYVDEAYILLGKASFFNGNYFNATEYFDYTIKTYKKNSYSYLEALNWKARCLMQLKHISAAINVLDTLEAFMPTIKKKSTLAEPLATLAQMRIYLNNNTEAISYLKSAIKASNRSQQRIRWTYILAQLYENQKNYKDALINYKRVERSNAPFEMYFNANLNQIKLKAIQGDLKLSNQNELTALLKDDKNLDYNDQIYFQIAEGHAAREEYDEAQSFYLLSVQKSTTNQYQKGAAYLKIADLNFKHYKDYLKAKLYYDSTVYTLPKNYPGYVLIQKKNQNLQYLTNRYESIALQDTLQYIAKLPLSERAAQIEALVNPAIESTQTNISAAPNYNYQTNYTTNPNNIAQSQNSFYFSNPSAVSIGFSDFRKKWGNRKLENNWRQSLRSSSQETTQEALNNTSDMPANPDAAAPETKDRTTLIKQYTEALPITEGLLSASNQKIIDAYFEIASFYLQELNDPEESEEVYQTLLKRFPSNNHLATVYYSLFLINKESNETLANEYKNKVLKEFPSSLYAKTLLDPSFSVKQTELETTINKQYNDIFDEYIRKDFPAVIKKADENQKIGINSLSPQLAYLKAIAIGRTNNVDSLITALNIVVTRFPDDRVIVPLIKEHIDYINAHLTDFKKRQIALIDFDPNEPPFVEKSMPAPVQIKKQTQFTVPLADQKTTEKTASIPVNVTDSTKLPDPGTVKTDGIFTTAVSATYYYVIHVADASITLSSSRFGIGQFNRGNYSGGNLRHQLKEFDNDQLIYVGNFSNFEDARTYASGINPQLKQIMKVPVNVYTNFIISKENFDKLSSKSLLDKYIEFYKNNY